MITETLKPLTLRMLPGSTRNFEEIFSTMFTKKNMTPENSIFFTLTPTAPLIRASFPPDTRPRTSAERAGARVAHKIQMGSKTEDRHNRIAAWANIREIFSGRISRWETRRDRGRRRVDRIGLDASAGRDFKARRGRARGRFDPPRST